MNTEVERAARNPYRISSRRKAGTKLAGLLLGGYAAYVFAPDLVLMGNELAAYVDADNAQEARIGGALTRTYGIATDVDCYGGFIQSAVKARGGVAYVQHNADTVHLEKRLCDAIDDFAAGDNSPESYFAVEVAAHEGAHVEGVRDERRATCIGLANFGEFTEALGRDPWTIESTVIYKVGQQWRDMPEYYDPGCLQQLGQAAAAYRSE